jgi:DNA helicase-2/ATP-dependent DNA helicase PcrA
MGTFHSIFSRILRNEHQAIGFPSNFTIYDSADSKALIKTILKSFQLDDKVYKPGSVASRISFAKNNLVTPEMYAANGEIRQSDKAMRMPAISEIYREYVRRCRLSGAMDFDDLLMKTNVLFLNFPELLTKYQQQFQYLLVDEYQDTNYAQYLIVKKLASTHRNICVVGDDAQSIYSFRGARIENILSFQTDYPDHKIFKLEQNYRSTQTIVNAANSIIAKNKRQIPKHVYSRNDQGSLIRVMAALTDNEEGFIVAQEIAEMQLRNYYRNQDFAILYRTNAQSRIFEESLRKRNIPYKIYGGLSFYQRKEIKDLLSYFRVVINPSDNEALKRIINYPARGIGQSTLTKLEETAMSADMSIWDVITRLPGENPAGLNRGTISKIQGFVFLIDEFKQLTAELDAASAAGRIAERTGILKDLISDKTPEGISRHENIQELLNGIQEFSINALEVGRPGKLENFLEDVALLTDQDNEKDEDRDKVTLMTVHSAKGLEFKNVFVVGLEDKLFPSAQAVENATPEAMEEERRLFYVALTRAMERVWFSYANQRYRYGNLEFCSPSRFLLEMDGSYLSGMESMHPERGMLRPESAPSAGYRARTQPAPPVQKPWRRDVFRQRIESQNGISSHQNDFQGDDPEKIVPGMVVEHQRFGVGKVLQVEGISSDKKATVFFQNAGQKQLLLKYAKLKIKT